MYLPFLMFVLALFSLLWSIHMRHSLMHAHSGAEPLVSLPSVLSQHIQGPSHWLFQASNSWLMPGIEWKWEAVWSWTGAHTLLSISTLSPAAHLGQTFLNLLFALNPSLEHWIVWVLSLCQCLFLFGERKKTSDLFILPSWEKGSSASVCRVLILIDFSKPWRKLLIRVKHD